MSLEVTVVIDVPPVIEVIVDDPTIPSIVEVNIGIKGAKGDKGDTGAAATGISPGGLTDQILAKNSNADADTKWSDLADFPHAKSLALEFAFSFKNPLYFQAFTYSAGILSDIDIYTNSSQTTRIYNKHFAYSAGVLTSIVITRIADSVTLTKAFVYASGVLASIVRS